MYASGTFTGHLAKQISQPVIQSKMPERFYGVIDPYLGIHVPFDIMPVSDVTAHDQYPIDFVLERLKDECGF